MNNLSKNHIFDNNDKSDNSQVKSVPERLQAELILSDVDPDEERLEFLTTEVLEVCNFNREPLFLIWLKVYIYLNIVGWPENKAECHWKNYPSNKATTLRERDLPFQVMYWHTIILSCPSKLIVVLDSLDMHVHKKFYLNPKNISRYSEEDFKLKFWSHLIEESFSISPFFLHWYVFFIFSLQSTKCRFYYELGGYGSRYLLFTIPQAKGRLSNPIVCIKQATRLFS